MRDQLAKAVRAVLSLPRTAHVGIAATACLLWVYWPSLTALADRWSHDPQYSHGYLVPFFSLYLLWVRRELLDSPETGPSWWGLPLLAAGLALRFAGTYLFFDWLGVAALFPCLLGLAVLAGGWPALRWSWPAVLFLGFMAPLPFRVETALSQPLQRLATAASTYALQTLGLMAFAEGNVIRIGQIRIGIIEACNGLSMLVIFFALSTAVAIVVRRPWIDKVLICLSAIPIAIVANVARITVTGILHKTVGSRLADLVFHDLAGWLMMPFALAILWAELRLLAWVLVPVGDRRPLAMRYRAPAAAAPAATV